jgi:hypothetical protein
METAWVEIDEKLPPRGHYVLLGHDGRPRSQQKRTLAAKQPGRHEPAPNATYKDIYWREGKGEDWQGDYWDSVGSTEDEKGEPFAKLYPPTHWKPFPNEPPPVFPKGS